MNRVFFSDSATAMSLGFEVKTNPSHLEKGALVEVVVSRESPPSLFEELGQAPLAGVAVSYYNFWDRGFGRLDPWFFERLAGPLRNFLDACKKNGTEVLPPSLSPFNPAQLLGDEHRCENPPKRVFVELTRNCNSCCRMCLTRANNKQYQSYNPSFNMDFKLFKQIADTLFSGAEFVDLRGFGESTILPDFEKYLDYALGFNTKFGLVTNLSVQNDALWKRLIENNFLLDVSIDGATKETYEHIRRGLKWEHIMHNLKLIASAKDIHLLFTVQKDNVREIPAIIELANRLGVKSVKLSAVNPEEQYKRIFETISPEELIGLIMAAQKNPWGVRVTLLSKFGEGLGFEQRVCTRPWEYLFINYDGAISPCNAFLTPFSFGKFSGDWKTYFNSPAFLALRASMGKGFQFVSCDWCNKNRRN